MFKRVLFFTLAVLIAACQKEPERLVTVTFSISGVQSGSMTKADAEGVAEALSATAPTGPFTLTATSKTNSLRSYTITPGVPITMAVDSYTISGRGNGSEIASITGGKLYSTAAWKVSSDVVVDGDGGELSVGASYPCVAFMVDKSSTSRMVFANGADDVIPTFGGTDDYGVVYGIPDGNGWSSSKPLYVRIYPLDTVNYEVKEYRICSIAMDGMVRVQNGYWYCFSPGAVATAEGSIGVVFPSWGAGN